MTAGSAFLIVTLCDKLVDYLNQTCSIYITRALIDEFLKEKVLCRNGCVDKETFEPQLQDRAYPDLEESNKAVLLSIARATKLTRRAEISSLECEGFSPSVIDNIIRRLEKRNVVAIMENKYCQIEVLLLKEWLLYTYGQED